MMYCLTTAEKAIFCFYSFLVGNYRELTRMETCVQGSMCVLTHTECYRDEVFLLTNQKVVITPVLSTESQ